MSVSIDIPFVAAPALAGLRGIRHGFFTRRGGVSRGIYDSLNCGLGSADDPAHVRENRARVATALHVAPGALASPHQVHGTVAIVATETWATDARPKADAVATNRPGIAIAVGTADCGPVLFADPEAGVVGAAHAGWKGAFGGILESTVAAMRTLGAKPGRIAAVLGPTISGSSYEVGPEFTARFLAQATENKRFFRDSPRPGHAFFDLPAYIVGRLGRLDLASVSDLGLCTYTDEARFFSFRRATHRGEADYGRLLAGIALAA